MRNGLRIGTRGSQLALWQAHTVANRLLEQGTRTEIVVVKTTGDKRTDVPLAAIGGKGLFVKELEEALLRDEIDLAVHSLKDVPSLMDDDFVLAGFLERGDPRDAWVQLDFVPPSELPAGAVVGTSAPRRRAQFRARFPHLKLEEMRGNVDTRVNKLRAGLFDGAVLAAAGLQRLGRDSEIASLFSLDEMIPAAGQGIVALQTTKTNFRAIAAGNAIDHAPSARAAIAERGVLQRFGSALDCYSAIAVHATIADDGMTIRAFVGEIDGDRAIRVTKRGRHDAAVVTEVFEELVAQGARELIAK